MVGKYGAYVAIEGMFSEIFKEIFCNGGGAFSCPGA